MRKILTKLRSRRAVTLTEILITVLITSLTASVVAVGVTTSMRVYRESTAISDAQTLSSTLAQAVMDELRFATDISTEGGAVTFTSKVYGTGTEIAASADGYLTINGNLLLPESVYASCKAEIEIVYSSGVFDVLLSIGDDSGTLGKTKFSVCPLEK